MSSKPGLFSLPFISYNKIPKKDILEVVHRALQPNLIKWGTKGGASLRLEHFSATKVSLSAQCPEQTLGSPAPAGDPPSTIGRGSWKPRMAWATPSPARGVTRHRPTSQFLLPVHFIEEVLGPQEEVIDLAALLVPLCSVVYPQFRLLG